MQICTDSPLPTFDSLYQSIASHLTFPPEHFNFPALISLPSPMFPTISIPNLELVKFINEFQTTSILNAIMLMCKPMVDFLGISLDSFLPKIPGLDVHLSFLMTADPRKIVDSIREKISSATLPPLPFVPNTFYAKLTIPEVEAIQVTGLAIKGFMMIVPAYIFSLIDQVTGILEIPGMPVLPTIPTYDSIKELLLAKIPNIPDFSKIHLADIPIPELFKIEIPGFPPLPSIPSPLVPHVSIPEVDFHEAMGMLMVHVSTFCLKMLLDFIQNTLGQFITFSFPQICVTI